MSNEITVVPRTSADPSGLILYAMEKGADVERLEQLFALKQRWEADEARKAYVVAMVEFKKNPPEIYKTAHVKFGTTQYDHATIGDVTTITSAALAAHGISHRWDTVQAEGRITVACILTHAMGHSERTELTALADNSGGKNAIQQIASTVTYLQRYTLLAASGLAPKDMPDDDGRGAGKAPVEKPSVSAKRKQELATTADEILRCVKADDDWGAFGLYEPIVDNDEKLYIWPMLPANCRAALKRCSTEKERLAKSGETITKEAA